MYFKLFTQLIIDQPLSICVIIETMGVKYFFSRLYFIYSLYALVKIRFISLKIFPGFLIYVLSYFMRVFLVLSQSFFQINNLFFGLMQQKFLNVL